MKLKLLLLACLVRDMTARLRSQLRNEKYVPCENQLEAGLEITFKQEFCFYLKVDTIIQRCFAASALCMVINENCSRASMHPNCSYLFSAVCPNPNPI